MIRLFNSLFIKVFWLFLPFLIVGCVQQNQYAENYNRQASLKTMVYQIKNTIKSDQRYKQAVWRLYANAYLEFIDQIQEMARTRQISNQYARDVLVRSYDLFQAGGYSPNKAKMLYIPDGNTPPKPPGERPWLPETPPAM